jgi:hypothetical protein
MYGGYAYGGFYLNQTHFDPTHENYFRHNLRVGGPNYPDAGFLEVFREIFFKDLEGRKIKQMARPLSDEEECRKYPLY